MKANLKLSDYLLITIYWLVFYTVLFFILQLMEFMLWLIALNLSYIGYVLTKILNEFKNK